MVEGAQIFGGDIGLLKYFEGSNDNLLWSRRSSYQENLLILSTEGSALWLENLLAL